jgi:voltage-gated potassium channel
MSTGTPDPQQRTPTASDISRIVLAQRRQQRQDLRQVSIRMGFLVGALASIMLAGAIAYTLVEHTSFGYGLFWTLDTVSTLGAVPTPTDDGGRAIVVVLELLGIGTLFYALATIAEFFVSGQLNGVLKRRRTQTLIDSYSGHYIICGYGRVGRQVARDLKAQGAQMVVIDHNPMSRERAEAEQVPYVEGQATEDDILIEAGIERAAGIVACVDSDADNIYIALSARSLHTDILIIARASADDAEKKLLRAGADRVISPYKTIGSEMARIALHPQVGEGHVDVADYRVEQIKVPDGAPAAGRTVAEVRGHTVIVALRRADGKFEPQPAPDAAITAGDTLVALGMTEALAALELLCQPAARVLS